MTCGPFVIPIFDRPEVAKLRGHRGRDPRQQSAVVEGFMKREFLQNLKIGDQSMPKEVIDAILDENSRDIDTVKGKFGDYESIKRQLSDANAAIEGFKAMDIDGIKKAAEDWKQKAEKAEKDAAEKLAAAEFDRQLEEAIAAAKGRNKKAIRSLLDVDALRVSKDQSRDIRAAIETVKAENDYMFDSDAPVPRFSGPTPGPASSSMDAIRAAAGLKPAEIK